MSEPLYVTELPHPNTLTVMNLAALLHRVDGTLTDVSLHPRGCSTCSRAVALAVYLDIVVPPLYEDELEKTQ
jgi:hypothetical protein